MAKSKRTRATAASQAAGANRKKAKAPNTPTDGTARKVPQTAATDKGITASRDVAAPPDPEKATPEFEAAERAYVDFMFGKK